MTDAGTPQDLERTLRDLDRLATPVRRGPGRELWRFETGGRSYLLHFYPAAGVLSRGAGTRQFNGLKLLQKHRVPALRAVALLSGLRFGGRVGDGVLTDDPAGAVFSDTLGPAATNTIGRAAARGPLIDLLAALAAAGLGHDALRPESFLVAGDRVLLADAAALSRTALDRLQLTQFAHHGGDWATRADRVRAWRRLTGDEESAPPPDRRAALRFARDLKQDAVERVDVGLWSADFRPGDGRPVEWSVAAGLAVTADDWRREWPPLADALHAGLLRVLKSDASGDIVAAQVLLAGTPVEVVLKRPRNKFWYRYVLDVFRISRARRAWQKARRLLVRGLAVELPLAVFERRRNGYTVEAVAVFEQVPGPTLEHTDLKRAAARRPRRPVPPLRPRAAPDRIHRPGPHRRQEQQLDRVRQPHRRPHAGADRRLRHSPPQPRPATGRPAPAAAGDEEPRPVHARRFAGDLPRLRPARVARRRRVDRRIGGRCGLTCPPRPSAS